jgi:CRP-like cAMP-binding protein
MPRSPPSPNQLLASLSTGNFERLRPFLKNFELVYGAVLFEAGDTINRVFFPHSGVISLVVSLDNGDLIETAMIGRDGVAGASSALDGRTSMSNAIVQLPGTASVLEVERLRAIADEDRAFRSLLIRHEQVLFAQAQQSAACNASHSIEARMCRWLLRLRDLADSDELLITQEFLGQMLGVRRSSVSLVASTLQTAGLINYRRGHLRITDLQGLRGASCECYAAVKAHYGYLKKR